MKIILKEKVENLGELGSILNVKPGYARNFLVPLGKAIQATKTNIEAFKIQKVELEKAEKNRFEKAVSFGEKIKNKIYTIRAQAGEGGKLFGSVSVIDIAKVIYDETGEKLEKNQIHISQGIIRNLGEFNVSIYIYTGVFVDITINVIPNN